MTSSSELFERLRHPFEPSDLEWRIMRSGMRQDNSGPWGIVVPYVNRPALINRLNQVCGLAGWQSRTEWHNGHVAVGVGILVGEEWIWRWDGTGLLEAEEPHFSRADAGKGDFSMAFKRTCELFGIATYLRELGDLMAIWNDNGRYRSKVAGEWRRWDPPGLDGSPSYPGTIPEAPKGSNGSSTEGKEQNRKPPAKPEEISEEDRKARIEEARDHVRAFMRKHGLVPYHLDAVVQTHPKLKARYTDGAQFAAEAGLEDWLVLEDRTRRNRDAWEDAPKMLSEEFPTGPERVELLRKMMKERKPSSKVRVQIESAIAVGWNDGVEYWIERLNKELGDDED